MMGDNTLEVVCIKLSRSHPKKDICDYHTGVNKYGLGKGYYPFCRCKLMPVITQSAKGAKLDTKADNNFMDKLSRFEKSQILGSQRRTDDFLKSGDVLKSGYYDEPLLVGGVGYNVEMETFNEKNLTVIEKNTIKEWTTDSTDIKKTMWGLTKSHIHQANIIFGLFDKYKPNIKQGTTLYRGINFTKEDFLYYGFGDIHVGDLHSPDDKAIVSFSKNKEQAYKYASNSNTHKVLYILENEKDALDISAISDKPHEEENIITKNIWYNVKYTKIFKRGNELWKIIKIVPEEK